MCSGQLSHTHHTVYNFTVSPQFLTFPDTGTVVRELRDEIIEGQVAFVNECSLFLQYALLRKHNGFGLETGVRCCIGRLGPFANLLFGFLLIFFVLKKKGIVSKIYENLTWCGEGQQNNIFCS